MAKFSVSDATFDVLGEDQLQASTQTNYNTLIQFYPDRLVAGGGFSPESSDCPVKAAPYARECEDTLIEQQRLARDSRDGFELQRRTCW